LRTDKDRSTARAGQLHVIAGLRHWVVRDWRETVGGAVPSGKDSQDTGHRQRPPRVNFYDSGVRMRRTHDRRVALARQSEIIAEASAAGQQALVFLASQRLPDRTDSR